MRDYFVTESLGPSRHMTPEGFLICVDVPIGRTGIQQYSSDQVPDVPPGFGGIVDMERPAEEVFARKTISSFEGKPVTNDHPYGGGVASDNWRELSVGHIQNVRRGEHPNDDLLLADLFINDPQAIHDVVHGGKKEVSCGYDHDVVVIDRGRGRQVNIIGNHLAIVDQGRCGPRCAIGDRNRVNDTKGMIMSKNLLTGFITRAFMAKSKDELEQINKEAEDAAKTNGEGAFMGGGPDQHVHVHLPSGSEASVKDKDDEEEKEEKEKSEDSALRAIVQDGFSKITESFKNLDARISKLETRDAEEESEDELPPQFKKKNGDDDDDDDDKDDKKKDEFPGPNSGSNHSIGKLGFENPLWKSDSKSGGGRRQRDSVALEEAFDDMLARAEILVPGVRMPSFDAALSPQQTMERACGFKRRVLGSALQNDDDRAMIEDINGGRTLDLKRMNCDKVSTIFDAAAAIKQRDTVSSQLGSGRQRLPGANKIQSIDDLQRKNEDYWSSRLNKRA